jgi:hypothetical protein
MLHKTTMTEGGFLHVDAVIFFLLLVLSSSIAMLVLSGQKLRVDSTPILYYTYMISHSAVALYMTICLWIAMSNYEGIKSSPPPYNEYNHEKTIILVGTILGCTFEGLFMMKWIADSTLAHKFLRKLKREIVLLDQDAGSEA